jgi:hypothetical protein
VGNHESKKDISLVHYDINYGSKKFFRMEVTDSDEHTRLLNSGINYRCKKSCDSRGCIHNTS